jgi:hypothetical protein
MTKKLKDVVKKNPEPARGTNYVDPGQLGQYSAQNQVSEDGSLSTYLKSRGIDPKFISTQTKISHSKSTEFKKWRQNHKFEEVEHVFESASLDQYLSSRGLNPAYVTKQQKIAYSKSNQFLTWKKHHIKEETKKTEPTPTAIKSGEISKSKSRNKEIFPEEWENNTTKRDKPASNSGPEPTALERFRSAAAERAKKHAEIEKKQSKDGSGMSSAIDRLEKHLNKEEIVTEDNFADPQAATQSPFDGANNTDDTHEVLQRKRELSKSARIIKSLYKRKGVVKEETYDWEKDDKDQTSPGKKTSKNPKLDKEDPNALPNGEPKARAVMSGGTTMTGEKRDTVEIDPQMKSRPDLNGNKKDDEPVNKKVEKK